MKHVLFIGDAAVSSGFGRGTHGILGHPLLREVRVSVIGINFRGDPRIDKDGKPVPYPYPIYPAHIGGDGMGIRRIKELVPALAPDLIVIQGNPWNIPHYLKELQKIKYEKPVIGIIAVEGKNCVGTDLNELSLAIFWNDFGANEAVAGKMTTQYCVIPLGVDTQYFTPGDKAEAREMLMPGQLPKDAFIVGQVNRNQNRKRLDLTLMFFAEWIKSRKIDDAFLYMHVLPGSSTHVDLDQLAGYLGIGKRMFLAQPKNIFLGATDEYLRATYRAMDVGVSTSLGEGMGLTTLEGAACGVAQMATRYAAIAEWGEGAIELVDVCSEGMMPDVKTMIGGTPDKYNFIEKLDQLYNNRVYREEMAAAALTRARELDWSWIAGEYARVIRGAL